MKLFDTKIDYFGGDNTLLLFSPSRSNDLSLSSLKPEIKNKNKN
jgi:hypothetical protein